MNKTEKALKTYPSRIDLWLVAVMGIVFLYCVAITMYAFGQSPQAGLMACLGSLSSEHRASAGTQGLFSAYMLNKSQKEGVGHGAVSAWVSTNARPSVCRARAKRLRSRRIVAGRAAVPE